MEPSAQGAKRHLHDLCIKLKPNLMCVNAVKTLRILLLGMVLFSTSANAQSQKTGSDGSPGAATSAAEQNSFATLNAAEKSLIAVFGPWPKELPPDPGNELSGQHWAESLGQRLFHEPALSGDGKITCANCHQATKGFTDGLPTAKGASTHVRNTQGLLDIGTQRWFGWDGGADSLWAASLRPMLSDIEMNGDFTTISKRLRKEQYIADAIAQSPTPIALDELDNEAFAVLLSKAIAAYTRTLVSGQTPFDQYRLAVLNNDVDGQKQYPQAAIRGLKIFLGEANCHVCHFGPNFSNGEFHDTGRPFFTGVGQVDPGRYTGIQRVRKDVFNLLGAYNGTDDKDEIRKTQTVTLGQSNFGQWRTPTLRNLTLTAPYTHDGSLRTLREVVDSYADINPERLHAQGESLLKPLSLDNAAREDLVRFLETLTVSIQ